MLSNIINIIKVKITQVLRKKSGGEILFCFKQFLEGAGATTLSSTSKGKVEGNASPPSQAIPKTTSQSSYERNKVESGTRTKQGRHADPTQQKDKD